MKKFTAVFWRGNPQIKGGGYETTREIEARTKRSAERKARQIENNCCYGSMTLISLAENEEQGEK